jgi:hypothetical protein
MIQPLRAVHHRSFVALALLLPTILLMGLGARRPRMGPGTNVTGIQDTGSIVSESSELWQKHSIRSKFYSKPDRPLERYVVLLPAQELNEPDLLLYWAASAPEGNVLPGDAQLLGVYSPGRAFLLPSNGKGAGHLVLFSTAHQTVFDIAVAGKLP